MSKTTELNERYKVLSKTIADAVCINSTEMDILSNIGLKPTQAFDHLEDIKNVLTNKKEQLEFIINEINSLIEEGKPSIPLKRSHCTSASYKVRTEGCKTCVHCVLMSIGESDHLVCNVCNQAKKAIVNAYPAQDIIDSFGVVEKGICRAYKTSTTTIQDITNYSQEDWDREHPVTPTQEESGPEIPPEAEGHVDDYDNARTVFVVRAF